MYHRFVDLNEIKKNYCTFLKKFPGKSSTTKNRTKTTMIGERVEYTKAHERTTVKELGKLTS